MPFPTYRARRLRESMALRRLVQETRLAPSEFILPLFVVPGHGIRQEISSMPGQYHLSVDQTVEEAKSVVDHGIPAVLLFGLPAAKDPLGQEAYSPTGAVLGLVGGAIAAFSWDGSLAVQVADNNGPVSVIRWRDGTVIWSGPSDGGYIDAMPEPEGQRIAVSVSDPQHPQTGGFPPRNVYVVGPDGKAILLLKDVE